MPSQLLKREVASFFLAVSISQCGQTTLNECVAQLNQLPIIGLFHIITDQNFKYDEQVPLNLAILSELIVQSHNIVYCLQIFSSFRLLSGIPSSLYNPPCD